MLSASIQEFKKKAFLEGKLEGKEETIIATARSMLLLNLSFDHITAVTGLSVDEVERLRDRSDSRCSS